MNLIVLHQKKTPSHVMLSEAKHLVKREVSLCHAERSEASRSLLRQTFEKEQHMLEHGSVAMKRNTESSSGYI